MRPWPLSDVNAGRMSRGWLVQFVGPHDCDINFLLFTAGGLTKQQCRYPLVNVYITIENHHFE